MSSLLGAFVPAQLRKDVASLSRATRVRDKSETTRGSFGLKGEATVTLNKGSRVLEVLVDR